MSKLLSKEELARFFGLYCSYPPRVSWCGCGHCNVAAHIEAQAEEIARLKADLSEEHRECVALDNSVARLKGRIAELEIALDADAEAAKEQG